MEQKEISKQTVLAFLLQPRTKKEIKAHFGCSKQVVNRRLIEYGELIAVVDWKRDLGSTNSEALYQRKTHPNQQDVPEPDGYSLTASAFKDLFSDNRKLTIQDIAAELAITSKTVRALIQSVGDALYVCDFKTSSEGPPAKIFALRTDPSQKDAIYTKKPVENSSVTYVPVPAELRKRPGPIATNPKKIAYWEKKQSQTDEIKAKQSIDLARFHSSSQNALALAWNPLMVLTKD